MFLWGGVKEQAGKTAQELSCLAEAAKSSNVSFLKFTLALYSEATLSQAGW